MKRECCCAALILGLIALLTCDTASSAPKRREGSAFTLLQTQPDGWVIDYKPVPLHTSMVNVDGQSHLLFESGESSEQNLTGAPQLPAQALTLGIPFNSSVSVEVLEPQFETIENQLVAPRPDYKYSDERNAIAIYRKDRAAYAHNAFEPVQLYGTPRQYTLRLQRIVTIPLHPYQYNPATRTLRRLIKARISIRFAQAGGNFSLGERPGVGLADRYFESVYRSLLWNYDQAKEWRQRSDRISGGGTPDPTRDWFDVGSKYCRLSIGKDGWYKITPAQLAGSRVDMTGFNPSSVKIFFRGTEMPALVRADSSIEFYAIRNYGDSTYTDFYTDTSAYWLTWDGNPGQRYSTVPQVTDTVGQVHIKSARYSTHYESNTQFYSGAAQYEIVQQGPVPGKGWYWDSYYPGNVLSHTFTVDTLDASGAPPSFRVQLFGMTGIAGSSTAPDHRARFYVNADSLSDFTFSQRTGPTFSATFASTFLKKGNNTLKIRSIPTSMTVNQFYLDWYEIEYQRFLRATGNQLKFMTPSFPVSTPAVFTLSGFSGSTIEVFDLTGKRQITGGSISGSPSSGYTLVFRDTVSAPKTYFVVAPTAKLSVPAITQKVFADIRTNQAGADYIIITHRNFLSAALQLAAQRARVNGVRVRVVDVQDIYDEFNYGIFNATKIKSFLQYANRTWALPSPAYLLMFGAASWDYHKYLSSTIKTNFVPAYGIPAGDNWFGCFDSVNVFLPSLLIGRIPVQDSIQAFKAVAKLIGYDQYQLNEWNKKFMFISGGSDESERAWFNGLTDQLQTLYVLPPPVGGRVFPVYKNNDAVINEDMMGLMQSLVRDGLVYINFLGHAAGKIWNVDIGDPNKFENTNGCLPFVSSVSCNVSAFAEPSMTVLAEDFVLADNRGAIAMWGSSSLGYVNAGTRLVNHFLSTMALDSARDFGTLTTQARFRLWEESGSDWQTIAEVNLNPLLGDPLSSIALPLRPDLEVSSASISLNTPTPSPIDSTFIIRTNIRNFGLVPADSVAVSISDLYQGKTTTILDRRRIPPTFIRDSLFIQWKSADQVGRHILSVSLDPDNAIAEVQKGNNVASSEQYVYANAVVIVKPLNNQAVAPGSQRLVVTSPLGVDSAGFQYYFELDTTATFDSPWKVTSGAVTPGPVSGEWLTPSLANGSVYFWRARTRYPTSDGYWVMSSFLTSTDLPDSSSVRWRQNDAKQFTRDKGVQTATGTNGVTIKQASPVKLFARSLGYNHRWLEDYYSILQVNDTVVRGFWWVTGNSFLGLRMNDFTGEFIVRGFDLLADASQADSMKNFIRGTPSGNYLAFIVIFDGKTNVSESLYVALESLGSTKIRTYTSNQKWAFISRKGYPGSAVESLSNDSALATMQVANFYRLGSGTLTTESLPTTVSWRSFHWRTLGVPGITHIYADVLGVKPTGAIDTLQVIPAESTDVSLDFLNQVTAGTAYSAVKFAAQLSTSDPLVTPVLRDWWVDFNAPGDLAVSRQSIGAGDVALQRGKPLSVPLSVYNLGFSNIDSARVCVSIYDKYNRTHPIASGEVGSIGTDGFAAVTIPISTMNFARRVTLKIEVSPVNNAKDFIQENNSAYYAFSVTGSQESKVQVFADGVLLMDGDYVSSRPKFLFRFPQPEDGNGYIRSAMLLVDKTPAPAAQELPEAIRSLEKGARSDELEVAPVLSDGRHDLTVRFVQVSPFGDADTLQHTITVNVMSEARILQSYNFPNPFARDTYFTFVLTGAQPPEMLRIRIFTIAGRKIHEIIVPQNELQIGFNRIHWDGRDADGDELANGYYLYQVSITSGGKTQSRIDKLAKVR